VKLRSTCACRSLSSACLTLLRTRFRVFAVTSREAGRASLREANAKLIAVERTFTLKDGLPNRPWFQHQIYAPGYYTGYGSKTLPGVRESIEQKQSIVAAAFEPGAVVRDVARQADVTPSLIYRWRRDLRAAANSFAQVLVAPAGDGAAILPVAVIEIEFGGNAQVRIPASVSPALAAAVVEALARR